MHVGLCSPAAVAMSPRALTCLAAAAAPTTRAPPKSRTVTGTIQAGAEPPVTAEAIEAAAAAVLPGPRAAATATITLLEPRNRGKRKKNEVLEEGWEVEIPTVQ